MAGVSISDILSRGGNNFDLVRVLAAVAVIISHAFYLSTGMTAQEPLAGISVFTLGAHAVNLFFMVSGLLVSASLDRRASLTDFAVARILRIFPGLAVCVLFTAFVVGPVASSLPLVDYFTSPTPYAYLVETVTLATGSAPLPDVFETVPVPGKVNVPLWTLKYEVMAYLALGALSAMGIWARPRLFWGLFAGLVLLHLFMSAQPDPFRHGVADHMVRLFTCFFLGAAAYRLRHSVRLSPALAMLVAALAIAVRGTMVEALLATVALGYAALCLAALPMPWLRRLLENRDISYGLYIYGWPVAQLCLLVVPGLAPLELAALSVALAAIAALVSWVFIERPALRWRGMLGSLASARA